MIFTTSTLRDCGELLYGKRWPARLAKRLGVARSTVGRWRHGKSPLPLRVSQDIQKVIYAQWYILFEMERARERRNFLTAQGRREPSQMISDHLDLPKNCQRLWGDHWVEGLLQWMNKRMKCTRHTVYRWRDAKIPLPPWLSVEMEKALDDRLQAFSEMKSQIS